MARNNKQVGKRRILFVGISAKFFRPSQWKNAPSRWDVFQEIIDELCWEILRTSHG